MGLNILAWVKAKKYTDNAVSQSAGLHREIVTSLPITGDDKVIYMVPITGSGDDNYNEYMWVNGTYELIGNTRVDLTDYYNKTQVDAALSAKANIADTYTKAQVDTALSGKASTSDIPTTLSQLSADSTHRVVTDTEKSTWNGKSNFSGSYNDLTNKPTIPTALSQLSTDATHRVVTDTEKAAWNGAKTYVVEKCTGDTVKTVSAGSQTEYSVNITKSGYTPIGIVGSRLLYNNKVVLDGFYVSGNNAYICFRNYTNSSVEIQGVRVYVLYVKN